MIVIEKCVAFNSQNMKGRELEVVERLNGPAVAAICGDKMFRKSRRLAESMTEFSDIVVGSGLVQILKYFMKGSASRCTDRSILTTQELLSFGGPGHKLRIKAEPIGAKGIPQT